VIHEDHQSTYRELNKRANQLAHYLRTAGVGPEQRVAIFLDRSSDAIVGVLGVLKAGGSYLPLDPTYPKEHVRYMLEDAQVSAILTQERLAVSLPEHSATVIPLDSAWHIIAQEPDVNPANTVGAENLAYVIYTSGSTGVARGVMVEHKAVVNLACSLRARVYSNDVSPLRVSLNAPLVFDSSVKQLVQLLYGHALCIIPEAVRRDGDAFLSYLRLHEIDVVDCTPSQLRLLLAGGFFTRHEPIPALVLIGGEAIDEDIWNLLADHDQTIFYNVYGPTECTVDSTVRRIDSLSRKPSIGRPIGNVQIYLLDKHQRPVPIGVTGEVTIGGAGLARGYLSRPDLTAERFIPDPFGQCAGARLYNSGDLARYRADGDIEFLGRLDHQVKIRGHRIELGEIESRLAHHPAVNAAVVLAREDPPGVQRLLAYVVTNRDSALLGEELKRYLREQLPEYMIPSACVMMEALPLMPNGKVDRSALPVPQLRLNKLEGEYAAPRDALQRQLVEIWEELLKIHPISVTDNFFELGGDSLLLVILAARIKERLGKCVPMAALFKGPTIEHLSHLLGRAKEHSSWSALVPMQQNGANSPLFCPHAGGGQVLCYADLVRYLGNDQPFYGLQMCESETGVVVHNQIEAMASDYVDSIRAFHPTGPYLLGGWSMGGVIAFEMARQLQQQGQQIALLALIDVEVPLVQKSEHNWATLLTSFAHNLGLTYGALSISLEEMSALPPVEQLRQVWLDSRASGLVPSVITLIEFRKMFDVFKINANAVKDYVGGAYRGRVTLFRAEHPISFHFPQEYLAGHVDDSGIKQGGVDTGDPLMGWGKLATEGGDVHIVPGDHYSMIKEPHVKHLAGRLRMCIQDTLNELTE
jgi:amino acid adenylation domain-containing protein